MLGLENGLYGTFKANLALTQNKDRITLHLGSTLVFFFKDHLHLPWATWFSS